MRGIRGGIRGHLVAHRRPVELESSCRGSGRVDLTTTPSDTLRKVAAIGGAIEKRANRQRPGCTGPAAAARPPTGARAYGDTEPRSRHFAGSGPADETCYRTFFGRAWPPACNCKSPPAILWLEQGRAHLGQPAVANSAEDTEMHFYGPPEILRLGGARDPPHPDTPAGGRHHRRIETVTGSQGRHLFELRRQALRRV